jgi:uncharacterized GH25 family protein
LKFCATRGRGILSGSSKSLPPVRALFQGEPQSGDTVKSTSRGHNGGWVSETKTNQKGIARFKIDGSGAWMFRAEYRKPYPDQSVCEQYFYTSALNVSF